MWNCGLRDSLAEGATLDALEHYQNPQACHWQRLYQQRSNSRHCTVMTELRVCERHSDGHNVCSDARHLPVGLSIAFLHPDALGKALQLPYCNGCLAGSRR